MNDRAVFRPPHTPRYAWVIVASIAVMIGVTYGLNYSFSVFFKPLADYFSWNRETVSLIYSVALVFRGAVAIGSTLLVSVGFGSSTVIARGLQTSERAPQT